MDGLSRNVLFSLAWSEGCPAESVSFFPDSPRGFCIYWFGSGVRRSLAGSNRSLNSVWLEPSFWAKFPVDSACSSLWEKGWDLIPGFSEWPIVLSSSLEWDSWGKSPNPSSKWTVLFLEFFTSMPERSTRFERSYYLWSLLCSNWD